MMGWACAFKWNKGLHHFQIIDLEQVWKNKTWCHQRPQHFKRLVEIGKQMWLGSRRKHIWGRYSEECSFRRSLRKLQIFISKCRDQVGCPGVITGITSSRSPLQPPLLLRAANEGITEQPMRASSSGERLRTALEWTGGSAEGSSGIWY